MNEAARVAALLFLGYMALIVYCVGRVLFEYFRLRRLLRKSKADIKARRLHRHEDVRSELWE